MNPAVVSTRPLQLTVGIGFVLRQRIGHWRVHTDSTSNFSTIFAMADMASSLGSEEVAIVDFDLDGC
jgi:hypothetical protein